MVEWLARNQTARHPERAVHIDLAGALRQGVV